MEITELDIKLIAQITTLIAAVAGAIGAVLRVRHTLQKDITDLKKDMLDCDLDRSRLEQDLRGFKVRHDREIEDLRTRYERASNINEQLAEIISKRMAL